MARNKAEQPRWLDPAAPEVADDNPWILDIETTEIRADGTVEKIHGGYICKEGDEPELFESPEELNEILCREEGWQKFVAHNGIAFDLAQLVKHGWLDIPVEDIPYYCIDTLLLSKMQNNSRGGHSLDDWGVSLGIPKSTWNRFDRFYPELKERCCIDVQITVKVWKTVRGTYLHNREAAWPVEAIVAHASAEANKYGVALDLEHAQEFAATLDDETSQLLAYMQSTYEPECIEVGERAAKGVLPAEAIRSQFGDNVIFTDKDGNRAEPWAKDRYRVKPFNPSSGPQIAARLERRGWKPDRYTNPGDPKRPYTRAQWLKLPAEEKKRCRPKTDSDAIDGILDKFPGMQELAEYRILTKRSAAVRSWIQASQRDGNEWVIRGRWDTLGAVTHRMTHSGPNLGQIPRVTSPRGYECRRCFVARKGYVLVGADASGIELRMLAHYIADPGFTKEILEGDVHMRNAEALQALLPDYVDPDLKIVRGGVAKTAIYGLLYGAQDPKLGSIVGGGKAQGELVRRALESVLQPLPGLQKRLEWYQKRYGRLPGLDGRWIEIRHRHAALNTALQSGGAIVMKWAFALLWCMLRDRGWQDMVHVVLHVHDEFQTEAPPEYAEQVGELSVKAIRKAGVLLHVRCPLDGEFSIGPSWAETH